MNTIATAKNLKPLGRSASQTRRDFLRKAAGAMLGYLGHDALAAPNLAASQGVAPDDNRHGDAIHAAITWLNNKGFIARPQTTLSEIQDQRFGSHHSYLLIRHLADTGDDIACRPWVNEWAVQRPETTLNDWVHLLTVDRQPEPATTTA